MDLGGIGTNAGSGFLGIVLGYFTADKRISKIESDMIRKVDTTACTVCAAQNKERHDEVMKVLAELRTDLKGR